MTEFDLLLLQLKDLVCSMSSANGADPKDKPSIGIILVRTSEMLNRRGHGQIELAKRTRAIAEGERGCQRGAIMD